MRAVSNWSGFALVVMVVVASLTSSALAQEGPDDVTADEDAAQQTATQVEEDAQRIVGQGAEQDGSPAGTDLLQRQLTLALSGNLDGNVARVDCRQHDREDNLHWAKHAANFQALEELAAEQSLLAPVALNTGNSVFPGVLGRYLLSHGDESPRRLAELLTGVPLMAHGLGHRELSAPRTSLIEFLEAMVDRDVAIQAANLECEGFGPAESVCQVIGSGDEAPMYRVVERDGITLAVTTVLAEQLLERLAQYQREGFRIRDPADMLQGLVDEMRAQADVVIVQHQVPRRVASQLSYELGKAVEGIDLIISSYLIEELVDGQRFDVGEAAASGGRMEVIETARTGTPIVSANSTPLSAINVGLELVEDEDDDRQWRLSRVIPRRIMLDGMPQHEPTKELLNATIDDFCRDWGDPISEHAYLEESFTIEDLQRFVLNITRFATRSELALSNRQAFRSDEQFPLTEYLTQADIHAALPFENELITVDIRGSVLNGVASKLDGELVGAGTEVADGALKINGRPVNPDRSYRVAINDYLAQGGDNIFSSEQLSNPRVYHPDWSDEAPTIDDIVIHQLRTGQHLERGKQRQTVAADDNFPDLHRNFLWNVLGSLNASYNQVAVSNPVVGDAPGYDQSQLTVQSTDQLNIEGRLAANADSRNHGWNNDLNIQYAAARVSEDEASRFEETKDQIRLRSRYRYKRLRADLQGRWYVPDPVVEGQLETEFGRPDTRDWHRLDLRAIAAGSFQVLDPLDIRLGANIRQDINEPDGDATFGLTASYTLARISPVSLLNRPIRFESEVEYFYNDIGNRNIHEARSSNRIYFAFFEQFFFTTTFNAFLYRDDIVGELGTNTELTVGINYQWDMSRQNF